eukprot:GAHX01001072.1.p1 GENE.GAHX01001072.1~~GAHX01001072.1.p1  ORF type:complete len:1679 (+),score=318.05 GAHX01001072.1:39-5075(+)
MNKDEYSGWLKELHDITSNYNDKHITYIKNIIINSLESPELLITTSQNLTLKANQAITSIKNYNITETGSHYKTVYNNNVDASSKDYFVEFKYKTDSFFKEGTFSSDSNTFFIGPILLSSEELFDLRDFDADNVPVNNFHDSETHLVVFNKGYIPIEDLIISKKAPECNLYNRVCYVTIDGILTHQRQDLSLYSVYNIDLFVCFLISSIMIKSKHGHFDKTEGCFTICCILLLTTFNEDVINRTFEFLLKLKEANKLSKQTIYFILEAINELLIIYSNNNEHLLIKFIDFHYKFFKTGTTGLNSKLMAIFFTKCIFLHSKLTEVHIFSNYIDLANDVLLNKESNDSNDSVFANYRYKKDIIFASFQPSASLMPPCSQSKTACTPNHKKESQQGVSRDTESLLRGVINQNLNFFFITKNLNKKVIKITKLHKISGSFFNVIKEITDNKGNENIISIVLICLIKVIQIKVRKSKIEYKNEYLAASTRKNNTDKNPTSTTNDVYTATSTKRNYASKNNYKTVKSNFNTVKEGGVTKYRQSTFRSFKKKNIVEANSHNTYLQEVSRRKNLCLNILQILLKKSQKFLCENKEALFLLKRYCVHYLARYFISIDSSENRIAFDILHILTEKYLNYLRYELGIIYQYSFDFILKSEILIPDYKLNYLNTIEKLFKNNAIFSLIFLNFDLKGWLLGEQIVNYLSVIAEGSLIGFHTNTNESSKSDNKLEDVKYMLQKKSLEILDSILISIIHYSGKSELLNINETKPLYNLITEKLHGPTKAYLESTYNSYGSRESAHSISTMRRSRMSGIKISNIKINAVIEPESRIPAPASSLPNQDLNNNDMIRQESNTVSDSKNINYKSQHKEQRSIADSVEEKAFKKSKPNFKERAISILKNDLKLFSILKKKKKTTEEKNKVLVKSVKISNTAGILKAIKYLRKKNIGCYTPYDIAKYLFEQSINKETVGDFLGGKQNSLLNETEMSMVRSSFSNYIDLSCMSFGEAFRHYLTGDYFKLPREGQKIDLIIEMFAKIYFRDNPESLPSFDCAFVVSYAVLMLNTSANNPILCNLSKNTKTNHSKNKDDYKEESQEKAIVDMSKSEFVHNILETKDGKLAPVSLLEGLYDEIVSDPIKWKKDTKAVDKKVIKNFTGNNLKKFEDLVESVTLTMQALIRHSVNKYTVPVQERAECIEIGQEMFESIWHRLMAVLNNLLFYDNTYNSHKKEVPFYNLCAEGLRLGALTSAILGLISEYRAFINSLARLTYQVHFGALNYSSKGTKGDENLRRGILSGKHLEQYWYVAAESSPGDIKFVAVILDSIMKMTRSEAFRAEAFRNIFDVQNRFNCEIRLARRYNVDQIPTGTVGFPFLLSKSLDQKLLVDSEYRKISQRVRTACIYKFFIVNDTFLYCSNTRYHYKVHGIHKILISELWNADQFDKKYSSIVNKRQYDKMIVKPSYLLTFKSPKKGFFIHSNNLDEVNNLKEAFNDQKKLLKSLLDAYLEFIETEVESRKLTIFERVKKSTFFLMWISKGDYSLEEQQSNQVFSTDTKRDEESIIGSVNLSNSLLGRNANYTLQSRLSKTVQTKMHDERDTAMTTQSMATKSDFNTYVCFLCNVLKKLKTSNECPMCNNIVCNYCFNFGIKPEDFGEEKKDVENYLKQNFVRMKHGKAMVCEACFYFSTKYCTEIQRK